ncbi:hypothetical protein AMTR_s00080p00174080 [Amborella trichopoda]|uniref:Uncharacterized protein n=1 Tax=Amborella trichopoda TaxID=13333 RepID=W1P507_AMBTC|nr:hypothetical protein AMTR_s00080p00174080 [Amborella trichopoda]
MVLKQAASSPSPTNSESQQDHVSTSETIMICSDQETTSDPRVASRVQEMGPVIVKPVHELTMAPPSPCRMSLDPCPEEHGPSELGEGASDEGPSTSVGGGLNADEMPEQHEAVAPEAVEVTGNEGLSTKGIGEADLGEHSGTTALSEMTEGARDEGPDTLRGEIAEDTSGAGFELAPPEVATDMAIVPFRVIPPTEVNLVTASSTETPSAEW